MRAMTTSTTTLWNDVLGRFRGQNPRLVRGWFGDLRVDRFDGGVLAVRAQNDAQSTYLTEQCADAFASAAQEATGRLVSVAFDVPLGTDRPADAFPRQPLADLDSDYTFANFVVGPSNELAHAAAVAAAGPDTDAAYNPLFVFGESGMGKTHLLQAIARTLLENDRTTHCRYVSCPTFVADFVGAIDTGSLERFRADYHDLDVLIVDDLQFLSGRDRSQEEFFHVFEALQRRCGLVVLSGDRPPSDITDLSERLMTRFASGLVVSLEPPLLETRMAILRRFAKSQCIEVDEAVISYAADEAITNIHELRDRLERINHLSRVQGEAINLALAQQALCDGGAAVPPVAAILAAVARRFDVDVQVLLGRKRSRNAAYARDVAVYLTRRLTHLGLEQIGDVFGGRTLAGILEACRSITTQAQNDAELTQLLDEIASETNNATC